MITLKNVLSIAIASALLMIPTEDGIAQDWEAVYEKDGVAVSKKEVEDTNLVSFKGDTVYQQPVGMVLGVLLDNDHRVEWVDRLVNNYILESKNEFDYVLYQAFELPAIFSDRDYVYHGLATRDETTGTVTLHMQSMEHPKAPETVGVRAELINSRYILTPLENGDTRVEVEILTDPKGMMPAWFVNLITKSWPVETLNGIRGQFDKDHVKPHALPGEDAAEAPASDEGAADEAPASDEGAADEAPASDEGAADEAGTTTDADTTPAAEEAAPAAEEAAPAAEEAAPAAEEGPSASEETPAVGD
jgi:hypothetical protein